MTVKKSSGRSAPKQQTYFIRGDGIDEEVIKADICCYLGNDALVKPGAHVDKHAGQSIEGFYIYAYRPPTTAQLADLRADSQRWREERRQFENQRTPYQHDMSIGAAANIIDARYAREINVSIIPDVICDPFELPTYGTLIWPIGRARITCAFPGEADTINKGLRILCVRKFRAPRHYGSGISSYQHRLHDRPIVKREIPIVASLGAEEETLTAFIAVEKLDAFPDTGSEINVMDLNFAKRRHFPMEIDEIHAVCFANGSLQKVVGRVSVPLSFSRSPSSGALFKLVAQLSEPDNHELTDLQEIQEHRHPDNITIAADFYVLDGLKNSIILGEDLLASVNAFVCLSGNFKPAASANSLYPALATISLFKTAERRVATMIRKTAPKVEEPLREIDIADTRESDRYERERERIRYLAQHEQALATQNNNMMRENYLRARDSYVNGLRQ